MDSDKKILLVDDEFLLLELGTELLNDLGYSTLIASTGEEALEIYQNNMDDIAVVILDLSLPGMSGEETFYMLEELDFNVKVIIASGYDDPETKKRLLDSGITHFLTKPFKISELNTVLKEYFH